MSCILRSLDLLLEFEAQICLILVKYFLKYNKLVILTDYKKGQLNEILIFHLSSFILILPTFKIDNRKLLNDVSIKQS